MAKSKPGTIEQQIVDVMKRYPDGITSGEIRLELEKEGLAPGKHTHLDRRKRELKRWFIIGKAQAFRAVDGKERIVTVYRYLGDRSDVTDEGDVSAKVKAQVRHAAHGRCQMCGKTIAEDGIKLVVDHKRPRDWGGTNDRENLWAICEDCNGGKKAYFNSLDVDPELMKRVTAHQSVHVRIGELLKAIGVGNPTPSSLLEVVADVGQEDWQKRLRELRYPVIGWIIDYRRHKTVSGKVTVDYVLMSYRPWPEDPSGTIRLFEKERKRRNQEGDQGSKNFRSLSTSDS